MSGQESIPKYPYVQTSVWGGSPNDPALEGAVNAVLSGVTSTHIADTLYTTNKASFDEACSAGIPAKEFIDAEGTTVYEIHFSFGPDNDMVGGMLDDSYLTNCLNAQLITPVSNKELENNPEFKTNKVNSNLDFLKLFTRKIYLYPLFTCKNPEELKKADIQKFDADIHAALDDYIKSERNDGDRSKYVKAVDAALTQLQSSRDPHYSDPDRKMTKKQFLYWFNQNIGTIGLEPKTKIATPLISEAQSQDGVKGFVEERYVNKMVEIKQALDGKGSLGFVRELLYSYNFVSYNCSNAVKSLHVHAANDEHIRGKLQHTIGWNDLQKVFNTISNNGLFSKNTGVALTGLISGALELVGLRPVETPVNFAYNLNNANAVSARLQSQQEPRQKPVPQQVASKNLKKTGLGTRLNGLMPKPLKPRIPTGKTSKFYVEPIINNDTPKEQGPVSKNTGPQKARRLSNP